MARLTRQQVIDIIGHANDAMIAKIIATDAGSADLLEAFTRLSEQDDLSAEVEREPTGAVAELYDILTADEPEWAERER